MTWMVWPIVNEGHPSDNKHTKLGKEKYHLEELLWLIFKFKIPLEGVDADTEEIYKEFEEIMQYAINFIFVSALDYSSVWWRLFHCPSKSKWANALTLVELLFSLPASNGKVGRTFSINNVIKWKRGHYYLMSLWMTYWCWIQKKFPSVTLMQIVLFRMLFSSGGEIKPDGLIRLQGKA